MIRKSKFLAAMLMAAALLAGPMPSRSLSHLGAPPANAQIRNARASREIPDFSLRDLDGRITKLSQFRGHPVVIDFWATWCVPCRHQIPELKKLYAKYHQSNGLVVLGVACDTIKGEGVRSVRPFVREFEISYPVLLAEERVVDSFGVEAIPTTIFLSADGTIVGRLRGAGAPGELAEGVKTLIGNPSVKEKKLSPEEQKKENLYDIEYLK